MSLNRGHAVIYTVQTFKTKVRKLLFVCSKMREIKVIYKLEVEKNKKKLKQLKCGNAKLMGNMKHDLEWQEVHYMVITVHFTRALQSYTQRASVAMGV